MQDGEQHLRILLGRQPVHMGKSFALETTAEGRSIKAPRHPCAKPVRAETLLDRRENPSSDKFRALEFLFVRLSLFEGKLTNPRKLFGRNLRAMVREVMDAERVRELSARQPIVAAGAKRTTDAPVESSLKEISLS